MKNTDKSVIRICIVETLLHHITLKTQVLLLFARHVLCVPSGPVRVFGANFFFVFAVSFCRSLERIS
jgi:hypothetical protein